MAGTAAANVSRKKNFTRPMPLPAASTSAPLRKLTP